MLFSDYVIPEQEVELGMLVIEALTALLGGNVSNANVFRECGGARCAHNLVPYLDCRKQALGIVRELMMGAGGEDDMGTLLGMMHTSPSNALELKTHVLKVSFPQLFYGCNNDYDSFNNANCFIFLVFAFMLAGESPNAYCLP